ncbi:MAG: PEGA domain-containing protein [Acidobacteria bacterium]|nr:PEGA domain-containing protein [Acidobacteriota bacterium]
MQTTRQIAVTMLAVAVMAAPIAAAPATAEVQRDRAVQRTQRAVPRPAARPPVRVARPPGRRVWVGAGFYGPYYYGYYDPFWRPFYGPYGYRAWRYPYYQYGGYGASSAVRLQVVPPETEVYVDGYYVGLVDSFDGFFQRLRLPPGDHEIELYLDGHESIQRTLYLAPGETYRVRHEMMPLAAGAPAPTRPEPPPPPPAAPSSTAGAPSAAPPATPGLAVADPAGFGTLVVRVQPADATIVVDGERWMGHEAVGELMLDLGVGAHRLEVSRDGHHPYAVDVEIVPGEDTVINVSLPRADSDGRES